MDSRPDEALGPHQAAVDPYRMLGVPPEATDADLRRAYRQLALRHHPDHNAGSPVAAARFAEIQSAYDVVLELRRKALPTLPEAFGPAEPPQVPGRETSEQWLRSRIAAVERDYGTQYGPRVPDRDEQPSPYAPRLPRESLRARLTDWFRQS